MSKNIYGNATMTAAVSHQAMWLDTVHTNTVQTKQTHLYHLFITLGKEEVLKFTHLHGKKYICASLILYNMFLIIPRSFITQSKPPKSCRETVRFLIASGGIMCWHVRKVKTT